MAFASSWQPVRPAGHIGEHFLRRFLRVEREIRADEQRCRRDTNPEPAEIASHVCEKKIIVSTTDSVISNNNDGVRQTESVSRRACPQATRH